MKYRAIVLYGDFTFEAFGHDDPDDARRWCEDASKRNPGKAVFYALVVDPLRLELTYELEPA